MKSLSPIAAMALTVALLAAPVPRQDALAQTAAPEKVDPAAKAPIATGTPNLVVATVRLDGGWRASRLIGAAVYDEQNQKVGSVDDLIMVNPGTISVAIVAVGGVLGLGSKLIAVPYDHLRYDTSEKEKKLVMPGATKDSLAQMPAFTYGDS